MNTTRYYSRTQGSKSTGLWEVFSVTGDVVKSIQRDLNLRQASELVWRLMRGLD